MKIKIKDMAPLAQVTRKETAEEIFKELEDWFKKAQTKYKFMVEKESQEIEPHLITLAQFEAILHFIYGFSLEFKRFKKKYGVENNQRSDK